MKQDILFKSDDLIFSYRVAGILRHGDRLLLQRPKGDDYAFIGGHIRVSETSQEALVREFQEELHAQIAVDELIALGEIFFPWGSRACHQIALYYNVHLVDESSIPLSGVFQGYDDLENKRIDLDFCWVDRKDLENGTVVYPQELIPHILDRSKEIIHFVSRQL